MPTPSSDQPPDPSPPGFSTCPDDMQSPPRPEWDSRGVDELNRAQDADMEERGGPSISRVEESAILEERTTAEASSRATTMSPRPQSNITAGTSPASTSSDTGVNKSAEEAASSDHSLHRVVADQPQAGRGPSPGHRSPEQTRNVPSRADGSEMTLDGELYAPSMGSDYPSMRTNPISPSSFLRPGSRFHGTQQSEKQVYEVQVQIKQIDLRESFLCGYLRIQGLTEDHPTLTTYFEGEIIGSKYGFLTKHEDWGANHKVDLNHWSKFNAFRPFQKQARRGPVPINDVSQKENIFMRWKEHFLVPDHRVRTISGASFEGFYYICFNQLKGEVSGIYFHSKSEK
ncbi:hypothetical protein ACO1O0_000205 [Amphichorda felina]